METDMQLLHVSSFPQQVELAASGATSSNVSENPEMNWEIITDQSVASSPVDSSFCQLKFLFSLHFFNF